MIPTAVQLLLLTLPVAQSGAAAAGLDALIERTNAYRAFHLTYAFEGRNGDEPTKSGTLELALRAPDLARMRLAGSGDDSELWITPEGFFAADAGGWQRAPHPAVPPVCAALEKAFPLASAAEHGLALTLWARSDPRTGAGQLQGVFSRSGFRHAAVLSWLEVLRRSPAEWSLEDGAITWTRDDTWMRVSTRHGFPLELRLHTPLTTIALRLLEVRIDDQCEARVFELPAAAREARVDPDLAHELATANDLAGLRRVCLDRVQQLRNDGRVTWDEATRGRWETVLRSLHHDAVQELARRRLADLGPWLDRFAAWVRAERARDGSPASGDRIREEIERTRATLVQQTEQGVAEYLGSLPPVESPRELTDAEGDVVGPLFEDLVRAPTLALFDETVRKLLND